MRLIAILLLCFATSDARACGGIFDRCKPKIHASAKPKGPSAIEKRLIDLEKRVVEQESQIRAYGAAFASHQADIHALKKK